MERMISLAVVAALGSAGCSTSIDRTNVPLYDNGVHVFEAQVVNALTAERIEDATISLLLGKYTLDAIFENGQHTIYNIPYGTFRIDATAQGYNHFQARKSFTAASPSASLSRGDSLVFYYNNLVMYPEGIVPQGVTVTVYDGSTGATISNATVVATLVGVGAAVPITDVLAPNVGLTPDTLVTTSGSNGEATFAPEDLVLGGTYAINVFGALDAQGVFLVPSSNLSVTVGQTFQQLPAFLSRPFQVPVALGANNEDFVNGGTNPNLVVTFPYAIELCSTPSSHTWFNSTPFPADTNGNGTVATPPATNQVTATLSNGEATLTLAYNLQAGTDDPGDNLYVTFSGVQVKPKGAAATSCTSLSLVSLRNIGGLPRVNTQIRVRQL
jgi:hypothetical protein